MKLRPASCKRASVSLPLASLRLARSRFAVSRPFGLRGNCAMKPAQLPLPASPPRAPRALRRAGIGGNNPASPLRKTIKS
jgi:hypothetical protein